MMVRLQRVTLLSLHQYLGLGTELISPEHRGNAITRDISAHEDLTINAAESERLGTAGPATTEVRAKKIAADLPEEELANLALDMIKQKLGLHLSEQVR